MHENEIPAYFLPNFHYLHYQHLKTHGMQMLLYLKHGDIKQLLRFTFLSAL